MDEKEATARVEQAAGRIDRMLLTEIVDALLARGAIAREDIAGALLRTEYKAEVADGIAQENGEIIGVLHASIAREATREWERRFGLEPQLFHLQKVQHEALMKGQPGMSPLEPSRVIALYADPES